VARAISVFSISLPWLWLAAAMLMAVWTGIVVGHMPSYGAPDPKHIAALRGSRELVIIALAPALIAPLVFALADGAKALRGQRIAGLPIGIGLAGCAVLIAALMTNPLGLVAWFFD
jgi:hypothetical protein